MIIHSKRTWPGPMCYLLPVCLALAGARPPTRKCPTPQDDAPDWLRGARNHRKQINAAACDQIPHAKRTCPPPMRSLLAGCLALVLLVSENAPTPMCLAPEDDAPDRMAGARNH